MALPKISAMEILAYRAKTRWKRQKKRRGVKKTKARKYYRANRAKARVQAKKRYRMNKRNPAFKRQRKKMRREKARRKRIASLIVNELLLKSRLTRPNVRL